MMMLSDLESRLLQYQREETEVAQVIFNDNVKLKTLNEANNYISDLKKIMAGMHIQIKQFEPLKNKLEQRIQELEDQKIDLQD